MENPVDLDENETSDALAHSRRGRPATPGAPLEPLLVRLTAAQREAACAFDPSGRKEASGGIRHLLDLLRKGELRAQKQGDPEKIL